MPTRQVAFTAGAFCALFCAVACGSRTALVAERAVTIDRGDAGRPPAADAASPIDAAGSPPACGLVRARVFVTSTLYTGALGGVRGADAACMTRAREAGLGGQWRAWLSDARTPATAHVYAAEGGYALVDGTVVAPTFAALVSGSLAHPIDLTEEGAPITDGNTEVWTGIDLRNGSPNQGYCADDSGNDWSSSAHAALFPFVGHANASDATWTAVYLQFCDRTNVRLYCFEACD